MFLILGCGFAFFVLSFNFYIMFLTIVVFIIVLSIIVLVHELGHFSTARKFGARVYEFGLGLPPRVFGVRKINGKFKMVWGRKEPEDGPTVYSLNLIPVGGFVKIKGENGEEGNDLDSFSSKPIWQRSIMISAGVIMNVVLCAILLMFGFGIGMPAVVDESDSRAIISDKSIQIISVLPETNAKLAGIEVGDIIKGIDDKKFDSIVDINDYLDVNKGSQLRVSIDRKGEEMEKVIEVGKYTFNGEEFDGFGVSLIETAIVRYPWYLAIWKGMVATYVWLVTIVVAFATIIKNLVIGAPTGVEVAGPVGIAVLTGQAAKLGFVYILQFIALLSLNLAIINILPLPALDGGRLLFLAIEKVRGKPVKQEWENVIHNVGFLLLMGLVVLVTFGDIMKYGGGAWESIKGLFGL